MKIRFQLFDPEHIIKSLLQMIFSNQLSLKRFEIKLFLSLNYGAGVKQLKEVFMFMKYSIGKESGEPSKVIDLTALPYFSLSF